MQASNAGPCEPWQDFDLPALAERLGTPLYLYAAEVIEARIGRLLGALDGLDALVCYAAKANSNLAILQMMADAGLGVDIVSGGELWRSLRAGVPAERIVFSGVGKQADEMVAALQAGIARFNIESEPELQLLERLAAEQGVSVAASLRINPDVDARTHGKISTGRAENKFGLDLPRARACFVAAPGCQHVQLDGLHVHIGSQMLQLEPIRQALQRVAAFWRELEAAGHKIRSIDVGGGLGVTYRAGQDQPVDLTKYVQVIRTELAGFGGRILLEPGRWLMAGAGVLLTRVVRVKHGEQRDFLVLDAAMTELARPALYDAWHDMQLVGAGDRPARTYDVVGPVCETGDTFARGRELPQCRAGDLVLIKMTGAYGAAMASTYNSRPLAAEALLRGNQYALIRRRQTLADLVADERPATNWQPA